jgi:hypothetical protein
MSTRLTPRGIVNAYFAQSGLMTEGLDVWASFDFESKQRFRQFILKVRPGIAAGTMEQRLAQFVGLIPPNIAANTAKVYAADPERKHYLASKPADAAMSEQKQQLAIEGPKPPPVKGANEASLTSSNTTAVLPSSRDPEDGDGGSFVGGKRPRSAESFSTLQGTNNTFVEAEPKRQSVRTGAPVPSFGELVPFAEDAAGDGKEEVIEFSAGFKEILRQDKAATRDNADPEFKMQAGNGDDALGQLVLYNDGEPSSEVMASAPATRVNKAAFKKDQGTSDRKMRAIASSRESRMAKANAQRAKPADFVRDLTTGGMFGSSMFGSAAEVVGSSTGTGIGAALVGGGSGSVLDRMIASNSSDSTLALVNTIGKMIVASGVGAGDDDRLLKAIGSLGPRASEAMSLIKNPALFPQVAYDHLVQTGVLSRLSQKAEDFGQGLLDRVAGRSPPVMRGIGALPPLLLPPNALTITEADGKIIRHSQDAVMDRELQGRPLLNPSTDSEERPQAAMEVAATNMVQAGVTGVRQKAGEMIGNLAQQGAIGLIDAATENLPIPEGLKDAFSTGAKGVANKFGDAVRDRIQRPERKGDGGLQIDEIDDDGDVVYDDGGETGQAKPAVSTRANPPVTSYDGDGGGSNDTEMVPAQRPRSAFQPKPLIPRGARDTVGRPPIAPRPNRLVPGQGRLPRNFPVQPQPDLFKRPDGGRSRNRHPRMPTGRRPIAPRSEESKDGGGDPQVAGGAPPPAPGGGEPSADIKARFQEENTSGTDELPLRPEVRRAGLDSLEWPTKNQITDKLQEATYYVPKHEGRGTMKDNPLVRQNVLEEILRFRNTNPMPREQIAPSYPAQAVRERVQMLLQNTYSTSNGEQKLNANVSTPVTMATPMMSTLYQPTPWMDAFVPANVQAGGAAYTRAGPFYSLS